MDWGNMKYWFLALAPIMLQPMDKLSLKIMHLPKTMEYRKSLLDSKQAKQLPFRRK